MLSVLGIPLLLMLMVFDYLFALIVSSNAVLNLMKSLRSWKQMDVFHQPKDHFNGEVKPLCGGV